jgi:hypothetical protein
MSCRGWDLAWRRSFVGFTPFISLMFAFEHAMQRDTVTL